MSDDHSLNIVDACRDKLPGFGWRMLSPEERGPRKPPRFLLGPIPEDFADTFFGDEVTPSCGLSTIEAVQFSGDRLLYRDGRHIFIFENGINDFTVNEALGQVNPVRDVVIDEEVVLLCGPGYSMYGHWIVDLMPRIGLLMAAGLDIRTLTYLLPEQLPRFAWDWLEILGIPRANVRTYHVTEDRCHIRKAIIPSNLRGYMRANSLMRDICSSFTRQVVGDRPPTRSHMLYISREHWGNATRRMVNADEIATRMETAGCKIVYPEKLSIREQVELFYDARALIGEYGSGLHSSVFAPADVPVVAFHAAEIHPAFLQSGLCDAKGQDCAYVFGALTGEHPHAFRVSTRDIDRLERFLPYLLKA
ncbi:glycosyltransferase family 61 protein [Acetobacter conturbans]|uniref:DUF563 domain-containing protein n=1 Tax=Acetobacter conturbans TaxID=1737472 RepID=A0ABX0K1G4_9PROT|nr:glycosyltransferase 61 family protein [Acetobacter conturbans]NHN87564.1 DUF563 domain-containing protein [Acetobacter conturbans]